MEQGTQDQSVCDVAYQRRKPQWSTSLPHSSVPETRRLLVEEQEMVTPIGTILRAATVVPNSDRLNSAVTSWPDLKIIGDPVACLIAKWLVTNCRVYPCPKGSHAKVSAVAPVIHTIMYQTVRSSKCSTFTSCHRYYISLCGQL